MHLWDNASGTIACSLIKQGQAVCEVLISLTGVLKMIWSCPSFSKMAVKSVERGRLQTGSMKSVTKLETLVIKLDEVKD
ncbi:hypothetical protein F2Q69_00014878 [Brassica cretica]|uniref:Uncharacterized protein n=1 Tax=Brassica cretica TaxID=69181 RepID=A0A8S9QZA2_BRACR|nr:hypothetical protein F2Q69_00014878 [Brassica cretica]